MSLSPASARASDGESRSKGEARRQMKREALMHGVSPLEGSPSSTPFTTNLLFPCSTLRARKRVLSGSRGFCCASLSFSRAGTKFVARRMKESRVGWAWHAAAAFFFFFWPPCETDRRIKRKQTGGSEAVSLQPAQRPARRENGSDGLIPRLSADLFASSALTWDCNGMPLMTQIGAECAGGLKPCTTSRASRARSVSVTKELTAKREKEQEQTGMCNSERRSQRGRAGNSETGERLMPTRTSSAPRLQAGRR
ncbi:hypothetical protein B0J12DRAFT_458610 [Macrophomina phaseolina]|uniref:Transmembrane protein n=1 Tax=Macrophomina phaseolina TaxID=35725 RepID=A0ABQ8GJ43_9PEZI|nr:hypothetical protein B0J12DRAFT_458610 [Macrophomina phaseolina]